jgi:hypothetical protein
LPAPFGRGIPGGLFGLGFEVGHLIWLSRHTAAVYTSTSKKMSILESVLINLLEAASAEFLQALATTLTKKISTPSTTATTATK